MYYTVASLCRKYQKANSSVEAMNSAVVELTNSINNPHWISDWTKLEEMAKKNRGEDLMIYNVTSTPGKFLSVILLSLNSQITNSSIKGKKAARAHEKRS